MYVVNSMLAALALLVVLQLAITWCSVRSPWINAIVKTGPAVLLQRGQLCHDALKRARVTDDEIMAAVRKQGRGSLHDIDIVVLEADGSLSVIPTSQAGDRSACAKLGGPEGDPRCPMAQVVQGTTLRTSRSTLSPCTRTDSTTTI